MPDVEDNWEIISHLRNNHSTFQIQFETGRLIRHIEYARNGVNEIVSVTLEFIPYQSRQKK